MLRHLYLFKPLSNKLWTHTGVSAGSRGQGEVIQGDVTIVVDTNDALKHNLKHISKRAL